MLTKTFTFTLSCHIKIQKKFHSWQEKKWRRKEKLFNVMTKETIKTRKKEEVKWSWMWIILSEIIIAESLRLFIVEQSKKFQRNRFKLCFSIPVNWNKKSRRHLFDWNKFSQCTSSLELKSFSRWSQNFSLATFVVFRSSLDTQTHLKFSLHDSKV